MKNLILIFLVIGSVLIFFSCQEDNALAPVADQSDPVPDYLAKPLPNLVGTMDLYYTFGQWPEEPVWEGTVTFNGYGVFDGTYGMRFYHLSEFKEYSQASPFEEYFEIYTVVEGDTVVVLGGPDVGVTTLANKPPDDTKYRMNGEIEEAKPPFEEWLGRQVHMSGVITWQILETPGGPVVAPATAPGIFRIN
jgi:hypothetical protein